MKIESIDIYVYKFDKHYKIRGVEDTPNRLPGCDYYFEPGYPQPYSRKLESCLVKITTDTGIVGWGEAQAPILPETAASILQGLFGPFLIGRNPLDHEVIYDQLYNMMEIRGHGSSFIHDAISGIDTALWDIKGKYYGVPIYELLGGAFIKTLPSYVSGLREDSLEKNCEAAKAYKAEGFEGIKLFLGYGHREDVHVAQAVRDAVGDDFPLYVDLMWRYDLASGKKIGKVLDSLDILWIEAPMAPYDIGSHRELAAAVNAPLAIGEPLRTIHEFQPWFTDNAIGVAQPDFVRTGITSGLKICNLARAFYKPVAPHLGGCTIIGTAATWQLACTLPHLKIQEYQMGLFESNNNMLHTPLIVQSGRLVVPSKPGLGIEVNEEFIDQQAAGKWNVRA